MGGEILLDIPSGEVACLKKTSHASITGCGLEWKWLSGEVDGEEVPDQNVRNTHSLKLSLERSVGWTQAVGTVN